MQLRRSIFFSVLALFLLLAQWADRSLLHLNIDKQQDPWVHHDTSGLTWDGGHRPLNIVFLTWGSRGDHQPCIALGLELARRGHNVTVFGLDKYRNLIERHPSLTYAPLVDNNLWEMAEAFHNSKDAAFIDISRKYVFNSAEELIEQYMKAAVGADLLFGAHVPMLLLQHITVAEALKLPLVLLSHDMALPTTDYSFNPSESRIRDYGSRRNMLHHRTLSIVMGAALTMIGRSPLRSIRSKMQLRTKFPFMEFMGPATLADYPIFFTSDTTLWPTPHDKPAHWYATGYFLTSSDNDARSGNSVSNSNETSDLLHWIETRKQIHDRPLLYFGQGSFAHHKREIYAEILLDTTHSLNLDAITLSATVDDRRTYPEHIRVVEELQQEAVFPSCSVIVHHGGAGTASQCLRSGRPGICVPSMPFQNIWCAEMESFGAGTTLHPDTLVHEWTVNKRNLLTEAVKKMMSSTSVQSKAAELRAKALGRGSGVEIAANKTEHLLRELVQRINSAPSPTGEL